MIEVDQVTVSYGELIAVSDVSFRVPPGFVLAIRARCSGQSPARCR